MSAFTPQTFTLVLVKTTACLAQCPHSHSLYVLGRFVGRQCWETCLLSSRVDNIQKDIMGNLAITVKKRIRKHPYTGMSRQLALMKGHCVSHVITSKRSQSKFLTTYIQMLVRRPSLATGNQVYPESSLCTECVQHCFPTSHTHQPGGSWYISGPRHRKFDRR